MISSSGTHPMSGRLTTKASSMVSSKNFKQFPRTRKPTTTTTVSSTYLPQSSPIPTCPHSEYSPTTLPEVHQLCHSLAPTSPHELRKVGTIAAAELVIRRSSARRKSTGIPGSADCGNRGILVRKRHLGRIHCGHLWDTHRHANHFVTLYDGCRLLIISLIVLDS